MYVLVISGSLCLPQCLKNKMAAEIASGMSYLHTVTGSPIIHGDLKLQNILVGGDLNAKVSSATAEKMNTISHSSYYT